MVLRRLCTAASCLRPADFSILKEVFVTPARVVTLGLTMSTGVVLVNQALTAAQLGFLRNEMEQRMNKAFDEQNERSKKAFDEQEERIKKVLDEQEERIVQRIVKGLKAQ